MFEEFLVYLDADAFRSRQRSGWKYFIKIFKPNYLSAGKRTLEAEAMEVVNFVRSGSTVI